MCFGKFPPCLPTQVIFSSESINLIFYGVERYKNGQGSSYQSVVGCREDSGAPIDLPYDYRTYFDLTTVMWQVVLAMKKEREGEEGGEMMVRYFIHKI